MAKIKDYMSKSGCPIDPRDLGQTRVLGYETKLKNKLTALRYEQRELLDRMESIEEEIAKTSKDLGDYLFLENHKKVQRVIDENEEYENQRDNELAK